MNGVFLREGYLESRRIAQLDPLSERFYFHLLLVVDENGLVENDLLLRNKCFPALSDVTENDVFTWSIQCERAGLIRTYFDGKTGKNMLELLRCEKRGKVSHPADIPDDSGSVFPFAAFWAMYGKKTERVKCERLYAKISEEDREKIKANLPAYIASTPDLKFRKNPQTWINNRCWEDEIGKPQTGEKRKGF